MSKIFRFSCFDEFYRAFNQEIKEQTRPILTCELSARLNVK